MEWSWGRRARVGLGQGNGKWLLCPADDLSIILRRLGLTAKLGESCLKLIACGCESGQGLDAGASHVADEDLLCFDEGGSQVGHFRGDLDGNGCGRRWHPHGAGHPGVP